MDGTRATVRQPLSDSNQIGGGTYANVRTGVGGDDLAEEEETFPSKRRSR